MELEARKQVGDTAFIAQWCEGARDGRSTLDADAAGGCGMRQGQGAERTGDIVPWQFLPTVGAQVQSGQTGGLTMQAAWRQEQ